MFFKLKLSEKKTFMYYRAPLNAPTPWYSVAGSAQFIDTSIAHHQPGRARALYLVEKLMGVVCVGVGFVQLVMQPQRSSICVPGGLHQSLAGIHHRIGANAIQISISRAQGQSRRTERRFQLAMPEPHYGMEYWLTLHKLRLPIRLLLLLSLGRRRYFAGASDEGLYIID